MNLQANKNCKAEIRSSKLCGPTIIGQVVRVTLVLLIMSLQCLAAGWSVIGTSPGDQMLDEYFRAQTAMLSEQCLAEVKTLEDWETKRQVYRKQLFEMLGLEPLPAKTDLKPVITGKVEHEQFTVEKIHYQSRPGLYVTGNLYIPKGLERPAPEKRYPLW